MQIWISYEIKISCIDAINRKLPWCKKYYAIREREHKNYYFAIALTEKKIIKLKFIAQSVIHAEVDRHEYFSLAVIMR